MMPIYVLVGVAAFWFMEFVAWSNHKYLMHGRLWIWHKDHHRQDNKKAKTHFNNESNHFEKNDRFSIIYAIPAIILIGFAYQYPSLVAIGIGITVYGLTYFLIHDLIIHQRLPLPFLPKNENRYIKAIRKAHLSHHRPKLKTDFHNYGLLIFPSKFFKD